MNENDIDEKIEQELATFATAQAKELGLHTDQYTEQVHTDFTGEQRPHTTLLISGLTMAHDQIASAALRGIGYQAIMIDCPDQAALQFGKEFGNRGQCSPTYFTVGNLVKHLTNLREGGMPTEEIIEKFIFLTAGACGPCRFGTYVTEYRKALRDSGFDGFRVLLFQQQGGVKQATGDELGLKINAEFGVAIVTGLLAADVVNLLGYRLRPYEVVEGSTNLAIEECKTILEKKLEKGGSPFMALLQCRRVMKRVKVDRSIAKPVVSVIGEFWAMTTEGDGNHHLQAFLEQEGAEVSIQPLTNWILFMVWENRHDTKERMKLRTDDVARKGLDGKDPTKKLWGLTVAEHAIKGLFQSYAHAIGLYGHHLPDMNQIAELAADTYGNDVRGGEGHMEVGKLIHFVEDKVNHMTVSVKPFGCMPSSGVSDGVQSFVTTKWPEAIFLPIEITGDGEVNVHSRVQMMLFKARQKAREEFEQALADTGMDEQTFRARVTGSRRWRRSFWRPAHKVARAAAKERAEVPE